MTEIFKFFNEAVGLIISFCAMAVAFPPAWKLMRPKVERWNLFRRVKLLEEEVDDLVSLHERGRSHGPGA